MTRNLIKGILTASALLLAAGSSTLWAQRANDPVQICHKPGTPAEHEIVVDDNAVPAHLRHGDFLGPCSGGSGGSGN
jgi:hypothetical protein